jgi:hypothetical protein
LLFLQPAGSVELLVHCGRDGYFDSTFDTNEVRVKMRNGASLTKKLQEYTYVVRDSGERLVGLFVAFMFDNSGDAVASMLQYAATWFLTKGVTFEPLRILTDDSSALYNALKAIFPFSDHLLCIWHITYRHVKETLKKLTSKAGLSLDVPNNIASLVWKLVSSGDPDSITASICAAIGNIHAMLGSPAFGELSPFHPEQVKARFLGTTDGGRVSYSQHSAALKAKRKDPPGRSANVNLTPKHEAWQYVVFVLFKDYARISRLFGFLVPVDQRFDLTTDNNTAEVRTTYTLRLD